jgi:ParB family chromosome partitioning protein
VHEVFTKLIALDDKTVLEILTFVVAETLPCGSAMVEALGSMFNVDMAGSWTPDETFFTLLRDKETINAMVKHVGGKAAADARITDTGKKQKAYIVETLTQEKAEAWKPHYMQFPMEGYTKRSGISLIEKLKSVKKLYRNADVKGVSEVQS